MLQILPSKLLSFTSKEDLPDHILINNIRIESESQVKLLGVIIVDNFNKHIDVLCKNANRQINVLYRFRNVLILNKETLYIILSF